MLIIFLSSCTAPYTKDDAAKGTYTPNLENKYTGKYTFCPLTTVGGTSKMEKLCTPYGGLLRWQITKGMSGGRNFDADEILECTSEMTYWCRHHQSAVLEEKKQKEKEITLAKESRKIREGKQSASAEEIEYATTYAEYCSNISSSFNDGKYNSNLNRVFKCAPASISRGYLAEVSKDSCNARADMELIRESVYIGKNVWMFDCTHEDKNLRNKKRVAKQDEESKKNIIREQEQREKNIKSLKHKCEDLGFKPDTDKFKDCVVELM